MTDVAVEDFALDVGGVRLAARWLRPAPESALTPVVFLHEGLGCIAMWQDFPERIVRATGRSALVYDRYGHGGSDPLTGDRPMDFMHDEALRVLPEILRQCGIEEPVLIGHSDGGTIALIYAANHPVRAVVTEAAHIFVDELTLAGLERVKAQWDKGVLRDFLQSFHGDKAEAMVRGWLKHWHAQRERDWRIDDEIETIGAPLLAIQGSTDEFGTKRQLDDLAAGVSGFAEALHIDGCGHIPHLQAPDIVDDAVIRFLERYGG